MRRYSFSIIRDLNVGPIKQPEGNKLDLADLLNLCQRLDESIVDISDIDLEGAETDEEAAHIIVNTMHKLECDLRNCYIRTVEIVAGLPLGGTNFYVDQYLNLHLEDE
jgi:hypothetical protein